MFGKSYAISSKTAPRGTAWWQCPRCKAGGGKLKKARHAVDAARQHHKAAHPDYLFGTRHAHKH